MRKPGEIVHDIQKCESVQEALDLYTEEASAKGFSEAWIASVFRKKRPLPVLDLSYDVHGKGVDVLDSMGVSEEGQSTMWQNWALLPDDVKASWVKDFKSLDFTDSQDVISYTNLLIDLLNH
jgi:hypothetical protein